MADITPDSWNILVVDDEEDVHLVTSLALKRQNWHGRSFSITRADSASQAKQILAESPPSKFHVAFVDVVMETATAGLELCDHIRSKLPRSLRIILRTGQAGVAPEARVVEEFEIDYYLAKVDGTGDRIASLSIACVRTSMDVRMLLALGDQLESFAKVMQGVEPASHLDEVLANGLSVIDWTYRATTAFFPHLNPADALFLQAPDGTLVDAEDPVPAARRAALLKAHASGLTTRVFHTGSRFGLPPETLIWIDTLVAASTDDRSLWGRMKRLVGGVSDERSGPFGLVVDPGRDVGPRMREMLARDVAPLMNNWAMAHRVVSLARSGEGA